MVQEVLSLGLSGHTGSRSLSHSPSRSLSLSLPLSLSHSHTLSLSHSLPLTLPLSLLAGDGRRAALLRAGYLFGFSGG